MESAAGEPRTTRWLLLGGGTPRADAVAQALTRSGFTLLQSSEVAATGGFEAVLDASGLAIERASSNSPEFPIALRTILARVAAQEPPISVVFLVAADPSSHHDQHAFGARLRSLALGAAPELRVNAIGVADDLGGVSAALALIRDTVSMTGQLFWMDVRPAQRTIATDAPAIASYDGPRCDAQVTEVDRLPRPGMRRVFIRDLVLPCRIGVYRHEQLGQQRVRINLELGVREEGQLADRLSQVVCYDQIAGAIRAIVAGQHVNLVESLAEQIAAACLRDARVKLARVMVEKLDIYADAVSAGVEIERRAEKS